MAVDKFKELIKTCAKKANYDDSAIISFTEISNHKYQLTIDKLKGDKNELTFLFFLHEHEFVSKLSLETIRVETESLKKDDFKKSLHNLPIPAKNREVDDFIHALFRDLIHSSAQSESAKDCINRSKDFVKLAFAVTNLPYHKKADYLLDMLSNLDAVIDRLTTKKNKTKDDQLLLSYLTGYFNPKKRKFNNEIKEELDGLYSRLVSACAKIEVMLYSHPDVDGELCLKKGDYTDADALSLFLGDDYSKDKEAELKVREQTMSAFEYDNMPEFQG